MASIGLKHPVFSPITRMNDNAMPTYGTGFVIGKAVKADLTINTIEGSLYADDALAEYASQFQNGSISAEVDEISDNNKVTMFGYKKVTGSGGTSGIKKGAKNETVHGGFGYYKTKVVNGTNFYRATWFFDTVFHETGESNETKGENITFSTTAFEGTILPVFGLGDDDWVEETMFSTEAEAISWLHTRAGISGGVSVASASAPATTSAKN